MRVVHSVFTVDTVPIVLLNQLYQSSLDTEMCIYSMKNIMRAVKIPYDVFRLL